MKVTSERNITQRALDAAAGLPGCWGIIPPKLTSYYFFYRESGTVQDRFESKYILCFYLFETRAVCVWLNRRTVQRDSFNNVSALAFFHHCVRANATAKCGPTSGAQVLNHCSHKHELNSNAVLTVLTVLLVEI